MVFFAVLEGLYRDGVSSETVDLILKKDYNEHFVYCCPLCHPAYEAFVLYRGRPRFYGLKGDISNFGFGLDEKLEKKLRSENRSDRLEVIQTMIQQYVRQRVKMMRLSAKEEAELSAEMAKGRNKGMDALPRTPILANEKRCAICDGSVGAFKKPGEK